MSVARPLNLDLFVRNVNGQVCNSVIAAFAELGTVNVISEAVVDIFSMIFSVYLIEVIFLPISLVFVLMFYPFDDVENNICDDP